MSHHTIYAAARASLYVSRVFSTFISRPAIHEPCTAAIAASASAIEPKETKPKPFDLRPAASDGAPRG